MTRHYVGLVHQDEVSDYGISFPDFPGCVSAGADIDEVYAMGCEALALHVEGMMEDGESIPNPSRLSTVKESSEHSDTKAIILVPVDVPPKSSKRNTAKDDDGIVDVTPDGITVAVKGQQFFLGFDRYDWFKHATLGELFACKVDEWGDVEWPELDVSLEYESLVHPEDYPVLMDADKWLRRRAERDPHRGGHEDSGSHD